MTQARADIREIEQLLYREARLIDERLFSEWLTLFTEDGIYWIPIDPDRAPEECASIVYDNALAREERVYHLMDVGFPAQSPPSRTLHFVTNVEVLSEDSGYIEVASNQIIQELRIGDFRQAGLGELRTFGAQVMFHLVEDENGLRIALKKMILLDRDIAVGNLTMIL
jgi:3-phenylpropionate/cinnamic acid dioxygenase small subunit